MIAADWCEVERIFRRIFACQHVMEDSTQTINVRAWCCLCLAILFWGSIARRAKGHGVACLPRLKLARNAKVDQIDTLTTLAGSEHDVGGLEIAENKRWCMFMHV